MTPVSLAARIRRLARGPARDRDWRRRAIRSSRQARHVAVLIVLPLICFVGDLEWGDRLFLMLLLLGYNVLATVVETLGERHERLPVTAVTAAGALAAIFTTAADFPEARTLLMLSSVVVVGYYASLAGRMVALALSTAFAVGMLAFAPLRETAAGEPLGGLTYPIYVLTLFALTFLIDALTSERLRTAAGLERLHEGLRAFGTDPDLATTLRAISAAAGGAIGADDIVILLREGDHLVLAVPGVHADEWNPDDVEEFTRRELASGDRSPLAVAFNTGEMVVVPDVSQDPRFPRWAETFGRDLRARGYRTAVAVPLQVGGETLGIIYAAFVTRRTLRREGARLLLDAYAEQASMAIARAQAYDEERRLALRLADADRLKSEFLALVSHELRTPLTAAKGFVDTVLLQWDRLDDEQKSELLRRASHHADSLNRLITQLLDYTRIEGDWAPLDPCRVSLLDATERVCSELSGPLEGFDVEIDIPAGLCAVVDPDALGHVLTNVVANATKYAPRGTRIAIRAAGEGAEVVVSVTDEGPGIALEEQERIFERFYQSPAHPGQRRGAGLGLAIARRYVEVHGGCIWVESEPGQGAAFVFTLPLPEAAGESVAEADGGWFDQGAATLDN